MCLGYTGHHSNSSAKDRVTVGIVTHRIHPIDTFFGCVQTFGFWEEEIITHIVSILCIPLFSGS